MEVSNSLKQVSFNEQICFSEFELGVCMGGFFLLLFFFFGGVPGFFVFLFLFLI